MQSDMLPFFAILELNDYKETGGFRANKAVKALR